MPTSRISARILAGMTPGISRGAMSAGMGGYAQQAGYDQGMTLQSKLAQALSAARANNARADQDDAETAVLAGRPDIAEEQAAMAAGATVPQVQATRAYTRTGNPRDLETADMSNMDAGPPPPVVVPPELRTKIAGALRMAVPLLTNLKDNSADSLAKAAQTYQQVDGAQAVMDGKAPAGRIAQALAAAGGKPMVRAIGNTGEVFDQYTGAGSVASPGLRQLYGDKVGSEVRENQAQAGAAGASAANSMASAGQHRAQTDRITGGFTAMKDIVDGDTGAVMVSRVPTVGAPVTVGIKPPKGTNAGTDATNAKARNQVISAVERDMKGATPEEIQAEVDTRLARRGAGPAGGAAPAPAPAPAAGSKLDMAAATGVRADMMAGKISREQAKARLKELGFQ